MTTLFTNMLKSKLLTGAGAVEFGYLSAIREVADVEETDGFQPTKAAYLAIADMIESLAQVCDPIFAVQYREVGRLVVEHANTLV